MARQDHKAPFFWDCGGRLRVSAVALTFWFAWCWYAAAVNRLTGNKFRKSRILAKKRKKEADYSWGLWESLRNMGRPLVKDAADSSTRPPVAAAVLTSPVRSVNKSQSFQHVVHVLPSWPERTQAHQASPGYGLGVEWKRLKAEDNEEEDLKKAGLYLRGWWAVRAGRDFRHLRFRVC